MDKQLQFIQSCVRQNVSPDDLGYMIKWYFENSETFFGHVNECIEDEFFDTPNKIKHILANYTV